MRQDKTLTSLDLRSRVTQLIMGGPTGRSVPFGPPSHRRAISQYGRRLANRILTDQGRVTVTSAPADRGAFKTPTLREISRTAPYMHDGSLMSLPQVIDYYDTGGAKNPSLDPKLRALHLSSMEKADLGAFLNSQTGRIHEGR